MSVDESTCTRSPGWTTTASKLDILCPLRHVMFVSPQKHTVTREGHEVRERLSIGEHQ